MKTGEELKNLLRQIDHKSYKAYKEVKGIYRMPGYVLAVDHVQGDPFATPSRVRLLISNKNNFPKEVFDTKWRKNAAEDDILRNLHRFLRKNRGGRSGSGKSGLVLACRAGQEVMERVAVVLSEEQIEVRLEVGFPAFGRSIAAGELEKIFFLMFPAMAKEVFCYANIDQNKLKRAVELADDQQKIREALVEKKLVAFVADGAILPRESGVSGLPLKGAVPFVSPEDLAVTLNLPHAGTVRGMGIKEGVTLIAGGGYHGKSTLLKAIQNGVYNHIAGDGREYVITDASAVKLRAEEGRCIHDEDISMFINNLPNREDTGHFSTENASGSTSQAAQTVEALESGARVLLIDEDTSATNFMVRDHKMAMLVAAEKEPITPYLSCVRSLYENHGISTILVVGSSGAYLSAADCVIQMDEYEAKDVTARAKEIADPYEGIRVEKKECLHHKMKRKQIEKVRAFGKESVSFDKEEVDALINCLGKDNLIAIHETLVHVYGQKQGQNIYKTVKDKSYSFAPETLSRKDKVHYFTDIIFSHSDLDDPGNFLDFLEKNKDKSKNLNGVRSAITKAYGNNTGMKYYSLFKPYFKTISALK